jgi:hypothetical protein
MDINGSFMHNSFYYNQLIKVRRYSKIQVLRNAAMHFDSGYIQGLDFAMLETLRHLQSWKLQ